MARILLLEDDEMLSQTLQEILADAGYEVDAVKDGESAFGACFERPCDLYLLDVNVPLVSGFDFLAEMRRSGDRTPAIFVTALRDIASLSKGFDAGADDYVKKPFESAELLIRIRALLKKRSALLEYGDITYDPEKQEVFKAGQRVELPKLEREIFALLITHLGNVVTKEQFYDLMEQPSDLSLRVHLTKLKQRLGIEVSNIRAVGYRLEVL